jgi:hypothetical protein
MPSDNEDGERWSKFNKQRQSSKQPNQRPFTSLATISSEASFDSKIVNQNVSRSVSVNFKTKPKRIKNYGSTFESRSKSTINFYSRPFSTYSVIGKELRPKSKDQTSIDQGAYLKSISSIDNTFLVNLVPIYRKTEKIILAIDAFDHVDVWQRSLI